MSFTIERGSSFSRLFKLGQGATFSQYLNRYRVARALELLQRPGASVIEVAFTVGFCSASHLTHCFRRFGGMSPSEYRRRMGLAPGDAVGPWRLPGKKSQGIKQNSDSIGYPGGLHSAVQP